MNQRFVEGFYWASTFQSVTRAAEKLCITQSALSSRIAALEEDLGVLLLDRRDKQFRLTLAGQRFSVHARRLLELHKEIVVEMGGKLDQRSVLRVGAIESVVHSWLTEWVQSLRSSNATFELALTVEPTSALVEQLRRGTLDMIFAALPVTGEGMRTRAMASMEMAFVGHAVMHARRTYTLEDLQRFDLLTFQRGSQPHLALLEVFRRSGIEPLRVSTMSSISAMVKLVEAGFGIATLPLAVVNRMASHQPIFALNCESALEPLQMHASCRDDFGSDVLRDLQESALAFAGRHHN